MFDTFNEVHLLIRLGMFWIVPVIHYNNETAGIKFLHGIGPIKQANI